MKTKTLYLYLFFLFLFNDGFAQHKTEIFIIGNIHDSVPNYNSGILFNILDDVKPDIILHEVDREGMEEYIKEANPKGNEIKASNLFIQKYPGTERLPFDFEGRNQYRRNMGMVPTDNLTVKLIDSLYKSKQLSRRETKNYRRFSELTGELMKIATLPPERFNNSHTDKIARKRQHYQYKELLKIVQNRKEFNENYVVKPDHEKISYREGFKRMSDFWDVRNKTMAKNIYNIAFANPNKKIVVLTGFLHRYYLIEELQKLNNSSFIIKEFYK